MKLWKIWVSVSALIVLLGLCAITAALWNNITSAWTVEASAAQYALNHSPLNQLVSHDVFTGAGEEEVFLGRDVFGRPYYAFVSEPSLQVWSAPASGMLTKQSVLSMAKTKYHMKVTSAHLGYLDPGTAAIFNTSATVVWELYGSVASKTAYLYVDAYSGAFVWQPKY